MFIQVFVSEFDSVIKSYRSALCSGNTSEIVKLDVTITRLIIYFHTLEIYNDFQQNCTDKTIVRILEKLDETFLYTNNMKLLVLISSCFLPDIKVNPTNFNWVNLDLSLPETYYFARLEQLYKKYEKYFMCAEGLELPGLKKGLSELEMIKEKSSMEENKVQKKVSKNDKNPLEKITLEELLDFKSMTKIAQHL